MASLEEVQSLLLANKELVYVTLAFGVIGYLLVGLLNKSGSAPRSFNDFMTLPYFRSTKKLGFKDELILAMLESSLEKGPCFVVTDPAQADNPIVYASPAFCSHTGYAKAEVEGRNCRFLQGAKTDKADVKKIRDAIDQKRACSVCLLNYRKNGSTFVNQFFLTPLFLDGEDGKEVGYYLGVQAEVAAKADGLDRENPAFKIYSYFSQ